LWVEENKTAEDWASVLNLASKWSFESLRARAIAKVVEAAASPVDQILVGRKYDVHDLLALGYASLCQSVAPLSYEEGVQLGMRDVINIYRLRYELYGSDTRPSVPSNEVLDKVRIYMSSQASEDSTVDGHDSDVDHSDIDGSKISTSVSPAGSSAVALRTSDAEPNKKSALAGDSPDPQQGVLEGSDQQAPNPVFEFDQDNTRALGIGFALPSDTTDDIDGTTSGDGAGHSIFDPGDWDITGTTIPSRGLNDASGPKSTSSAVNDNPACQQSLPDVLTWVEGIGAQVPFEGEQTSASEPSIEHPIIPNMLSGSSRATSVAIPDPSEAAIQALLNSLTKKKKRINLISNEIINQMKSDPTGSQMIIQTTRLVVKKAVKEVGQSKTCSRLCNAILRGDWNATNSDGNATTGEQLFCTYLRENLESILIAAVSIVSLPVGWLAAVVGRNNIFKCCTAH
jgi:hypothetical protein